MHSLPPEIIENIGFYLPYEKAICISRNVLKKLMNAMAVEQRQETNKADNGDNKESVKLK
jgi:hypothetical protein